MTDKLTILADMDGPLAGFDAAYFARCHENGWTLDCEPHEQRHRFAYNHLTHPRTADLARAMVNSEGWFRDLPVTPGAQEGLERLAAIHDVWVVSKPLEANPTCRDEKAAWLVEHFGKQWERRLILTNDKSMIRGDILLDDAPDPAWFDAASWVPVVFRMPWNGAGSKWELLPHWSWTLPIEVLETIWVEEASARVGL